MQIRRLLGTIAAATALVTMLGACGDTDDDAADESPAETSEESTDDAATDDGGDDAAAGETSLEFTAMDIEFGKTEASAAAGELQVTLVNEGQIEHSWLVEEHEDDLRLHVEANGDTDEGTISLEPGEYTYYCDVTGHRQAGMEGTLTVE